MPEDTHKPWWHDSLMSFFRISAWIIGPILIGVILGDWLDTKLGTTPFIEIVLTGLLFAFSIFRMIRSGKLYEEELDHHDHPEKYEHLDQNNDHHE